MAERRPDHRPDHRPNHEAFEPIEQLLRSALSAHAAAVRPSPDGLHRIRAAIEAPAPAPARGRGWLRVAGGIVPAGPPRLSGLGRPAPSRARRYWLPAMAAAAAIGVMALAAPQLIGVRGAVPSSVAAIGSGGSSGAPTSPPVPVVEPLPVYYTTQQQGRWALVREFAPTTLTDPARRLAEAVRLAIAGRGTDPDYTSVWRSAHLTSGTATGLVAAVSVSSGSDGIEIRLDPALARSREVSMAQSRLAVQQLTWTATATAQQTVPVRITSADGSSRLFGQVGLTNPFERTVADADPRAPVWANSILDGQRLGTGTTTILGDVAAGSGPVRWRLQRITGDRTSPSPTAEIVGSGLAETQIDGPAGGAPTAMPTGTPEGFTRIVWTARLTLSEPGTYLLEVLAGGWTETKTLVVR